MRLSRLMTATAVAALIAGAAQAQQVPAVGAPAPQTGATASANVAPAGDIVETVKASGQFTTLVTALEATNLVQLLKTTPNLTVFAPTDAAFAALPAGELDRLMAEENRAELQKLLTYHVVNARVESSKIQGAQGPVPTVAGENLQVDGVGETMMVGRAQITQSDINAENGLIHVVDKVLTPGAVPVQASPAADAGTDASATAASKKAAKADQVMSEPRDAAAVPAEEAVVSAEGAPTGSAADVAATEPQTDMQPIPDTPDNRATHGAPLSNAGKRTSAEGN
ncbi:fasciclin domain-containing protein [Phenylobacterium sp.]|uniref:fasciclin domain-containing protein n=1 Tax=Phenylobacterium sp. TaxID=1871053 RepID=UPI00272FC1B7|nr:fasciclin domain-containing protein [Phenylobacterium sp.]MDP2213787.1 fasciclin domain-containing protein [Phenylobacterium sp.]